MKLNIQTKFLSAQHQVELFNTLCSFENNLPQKDVRILNRFIEKFQNAQVQFDRISHSLGSLQRDIHQKQIQSSFGPLETFITENLFRHLILFRLT